MFGFYPFGGFALSGLENQSTEAVSDTLSTTESISGTLSVIQNFSDFISITGSSLAILAMNASASDNITLADSGSSFFNVIEANSDSITITDSVSNSLSDTESASDSIELIDSESNVVFGVEGSFDLIVISESESAIKNELDFISITDSVQNILSASNLAIDNISFNGLDSSTTVYSSNNNVSDSFIFLESEFISFSSANLCSDMISITDYISESASSLWNPIPPPLSKTWTTVFSG